MNILERAIETYGEDMQLNVAIEEFSELIKEICKHKRGEDNRDNIIEEMADCYIMLEQLGVIFGIWFEEIEYKKVEKLDRLEKKTCRKGEQTMRDKQTQIEREEIAEIIAQNFDLNGEKWDASDFEWAAHCVQMAGYRKASDVVREIFEEIWTSIDECTIVHKFKEPSYDLPRFMFRLAELKKKYESEGEG